MKTVLIIDDEELIRSSLARALKLAGHKAEQARDGLEALALLERRFDKIDLIISDVQMPGMNGLAFLAARPASMRHIPVILCSGHQDLPKWAAEADVMYVAKGDPKTLIARIKEVLR